MRLLHVSDLHANDAWFRWLVSQSDEADLICVTGDLLNLNAHRPLGDQLERVTAYLDQIKTPIALCSGNHDSLAGAGTRFQHAGWLRNLKRENVWVDGDKFELGGFCFRCIPWLGQLDTATAGEIWLIHSPPDEAATGITRGGVGFGNFHFGELCRTGLGPRLALSGHIHDPFSWRAKISRTWSLNTGCHEAGKSPNFINVNLDRGIALRQEGTGRSDVARLW